MSETAELVGTSPDDMLEAQVLQHEDILDALLEKARATGGSAEGPRFPVKLIIDGEEVTVTDSSPEEKARAAQEAVAKRVEQADTETFKYAQFKLEQLNEVEAVDFIRSLLPGDRDIYLQAEKEGQNRKAIFTVFGDPIGSSKVTAKRKREGK
jgi:hypothetical protein